MTAPSKFSGTDGVSAERWLRSLKRDLSPDLTASEWLLVVDTLLVGEAASWADQHPRVKRILTDEYVLHDERCVANFSKAIIARFPGIEVVGPEKGQALMQFLKQGPLETLEAYYRRAEKLMHATGGVDRSEAPLSDKEEEGLKKAIEKYMFGLREQEIKDSTVLYWKQRSLQVSDNPLSLLEIYQYSVAMLEKTTFQKGMLEVASAKHDTRFSSSSYPDLTFSGLFGTAGDSHDSYTRTGYGSHNVPGRVYIVGPKGIAVVSEDLAKQWVVKDTINSITEAANGSPAAAKGVNTSSSSNQRTISISVSGDLEGFSLTDSGRTVTSETPRETMSSLPKVRTNKAPKSILKRPPTTDNSARPRITKATKDLDEFDFTDVDDPFLTPKTSTAPSSGDESIPVLENATNSVVATSSSQGPVKTSPPRTPISCTITNPGGLRSTAQSAANTEEKHSTNPTVFHNPLALNPSPRDSSEHGRPTPPLSATFNQPTTEIPSSDLSQTASQPSSGSRLSESPGASTIRAPPPSPSRVRPRRRFSLPTVTGPNATGPRFTFLPLFARRSNSRAYSGTERSPSDGRYAF